MQQFKLSLRFEGSELDWVAVSLKIKWSKIYISLCAAQLLLLSLLAYFYFLLLFSGEVPIWYLDWLLLQSWLKEQFVSDKMLHGVDLVRVQFRAYFAAIKPAFLCRLFKTCVQVSLHQWKPLFLGHMLLLLLLPIFTCGLCVTGWQKSAVMSLRLGCNESKSKSLVKNVNRFSFFYVWPVDFGYSNSKHKFRELIFLDLFIFHIFFYKVSKLALKSSS